MSKSGTLSGHLGGHLSIFSVGNIDPTAQLATTTLDADLIACKYRSTPVAWTDLWTGAVRYDSTGALVVSATIPDGASVALGSKADAAATTTDTTSASEIALLKGQIVKQNALIAEIGGVVQSGTTQTVAGAVTVNLGTLNGAATATGVAAAITALPAKDSNNDLRVPAPTPTPTPTIYETVITLTTSYSQTLVAASTTRIGIAITCDGTATVGISQLSATLASVASAATIIPATANASFTPQFASNTACT